MNAVSIRRATPADNTQLLALAAACPMRADLTICIRREPDFFALNRLQGAAWDVGLAELGSAGVIGCIAAAWRHGYVNGARTATGYVSDLKVHPRFRARSGANLSVADQLSAYAHDWFATLDPRMPVLAAALAGNAAVGRRLAGVRGLPRFMPVGTLRALSIPLVALSRARLETSVKVDRGDDRDVEEMADLWRRVAPGRQFAPTLAGEDFRRLLDGAPGLTPSAYWLARRSGRLVGFVALWDQHLLKQTVLLRYSWRAALFRHVINTVARIAGTPSLPPAGAPLPYLSGFQLCVPPTEPAVLRALLAAAARAHAGTGHVFCTIGLDDRDPLVQALAGLWAQATAVRVFVTTARGAYERPALDQRPMHFETALV